MKTPREPITTDDRISYVDVDGHLRVFDRKVRCAQCTSCLADAGGRCFHSGPFNAAMERMQFRVAA